MRLTKDTVVLYRHLARQNYINTPANMVWADGMPIAEADFTAAMQLKAALSVFASLGIIGSDIELELSESFVEIFDE